MFHHSFLHGSASPVPFCLSNSRPASYSYSYSYSYSCRRAGRRVRVRVRVRVRDGGIFRLHSSWAGGSGCVGNLRRMTWMLLPGTLIIVAAVVAVFRKVDVRAALLLAALALGTLAGRPEAIL